MHFARNVDRKEVKGRIRDEKKTKGEARMEKGDNKRLN